MITPAGKDGAIKTKLQVSNGYSVEFDQLARLLTATCRDGRSRIPQKELAQAIGMADRQVENLASIAQAVGINTPITYKPTSLGRLIADKDAFFDDMGTLWFLHYVVASEQRFLIWNRFANTFLPNHHVFTYAELRGSYSDIEDSHSKYTASKHVTQETKTILDAYTHQNFSRLAYLRSEGDKYALSYREPLPHLVLAACAARFRDRHRPGATAISIDELLTAPNSPGWVCQIPEDRLRAGLESLKTEPGMSLESRADLDQIRLTDATPDYVWMERYYASR